MSINVNQMQKRFGKKLELAYPDDLSVQDVIDAVKENGDLDITYSRTFTNRTVIHAVSRSAAGLGDVLSMQLILRRTNMTCVVTYETKLAGLYKGNIEHFLKEIVSSSR